SSPRLAQEGLGGLQLLVCLGAIPVAPNVLLHRPLPLLLSQEARGSHPEEPAAAHVRGPALRIDLCQQAVGDGDGYLPSHTIENTIRPTPSGNAIKDPPPIGNVIPFRSRAHDRAVSASGAARCRTAGSRGRAPR